MTYAIYDGNVLIADKMIIQSVGANLTGRRPVDDNGHIQLKKAGSVIDIRYSDCKKIMFPAKGLAKGKKITCMVAAGTVTNLGEILDFLNRGGDLDQYVRAEISIQPKSARRFFNGSGKLLVITECGHAQVIEATDAGIVINTELPLHIGSGAHWVNNLNSQFTDDAGIAALDAHTYASNMDKGVSMSFDYYNPKTGVLVTDQLLSKRQRKQILERLQARIDITVIPKEMTFVN